MMTTPPKSLYLAVGLCFAMVGCSSQSDSPSQVNQQESTSAVQEPQLEERLGTKWGDELNSHVTTVDLRRMSETPLEQMQVFYADKNYAGREINSMSLLGGKIDFSVSSDSGTMLPMYRDGGNYYVQGQSGQAYRLEYANNTSDTYEVVASVDGLNVIDGSTASRYGTGYVLEPHDSLVIEGFRKSQDAVASFIFSEPDSSYAANSDMSSVNNTGVIGTVIYELYDPTKPRPVQSSQSNTPQAFPADEVESRYAPPPQ